MCVPLTIFLLSRTPMTLSVSLLLLSLIVGFVCVCTSKPGVGASRAMANYDIRQPDAESKNFGVTIKEFRISNYRDEIFND